MKATSIHQPSQRLPALLIAENSDSDPLLGTEQSS